jgi:hypothetical protein
MICEDPWKTAGPFVKKPGGAPKLAKTSAMAPHAHRTLTLKGFISRFMRCTIHC